MALDLYQDFEQLSYAAWQAALERAAKGAKLEDLHQQIEADLALEPWVDQAELASWESLAQLPSLGSTWLLAERIPLASPAEANAQALQALAGGAELLIFENAQTAELLQGIYTDMVELRFLPELQPQMLQSQAPSLSERLADLLCQAETHWQKNPSSPVWLNWSLSGQYWSDLAALRVLRLLWLKLQEAWGLAPCLPWIHAHSEALEGEDYQSLLAHSTRAMSAVLGGINSLELCPPTSAQGAEFARRMSRNIQHLLRMESFMDRVQDPAAGSYYLERLCQKLAHKTWERFLSLKT